MTSLPSSSEVTHDPSMPRVANSQRWSPDSLRTSKYTAARYQLLLNSFGRGSNLAKTILHTELENYVHSSQLLKNNLEHSLSLSSQNVTLEF